MKEVGAMIQYSFAGNGNIMPCPWMDDCINYPAGCSGGSYWCKRFDSEEDRREMIKTKARWDYTKKGDKDGRVNSSN